LSRFSNRLIEQFMEPGGTVIDGTNTYLAARLHLERTVSDDLFAGCESLDDLYLTRAPGTDPYLSA
jgi:hypothetical protein